MPELDVTALFDRRLCSFEAIFRCHPPRAFRFKISRKIKISFYNDSEIEHGLTVFEKRIDASLARLREIQEKY